MARAGACPPEAPIGGPHPEPKASAGITAVLAHPATEPLTASLAIAELLAGTAGRPATEGQRPRSVASFETELVGSFQDCQESLSWLHVGHVEVDPLNTTTTTGVVILGSDGGDVESALRLAVKVVVGSSRKSSRHRSGSGRGSGSSSSSSSSSRSTTSSTST